MHRKCRAVDAFKSVEIELGQNPIHVAQVQATASKNRDTVYTNRRTPPQILNLRKESIQNWKWTCMSTT